LQGLSREFGHALAPVPGAAGLHLAARATTGVEVEPLVERARRAGIGVSSIADYGAGAALPRGILFGFGAVDAARIAPGLTRLRSLLGKVD